MSGTATCSELNNPLPRWWAILFVLTVVFAGVYLVLYPGLGSYSGELKWSEEGQYQAEMKKAQSELAPLYASFGGMTPQALAADPKARAIGERLFVNNCAACHGSDARGSIGFPNLTDGDWLWGGTPEDIVTTITNGRVGNMPPMAAAVGSAEDVRNVANYVLSLSGSPHNNVAAQLGQGQVRRLCGLPRPRRQGQHGNRCAEPDRQDLAARLWRGNGRASGHAGLAQRDAGAGRPPERSPDPRAGGLRVESVAVDRNRSGQASELHTLGDGQSRG